MYRAAPKMRVRGFWLRRLGEPPNEGLWPDGWTTRVSALP